LVKTLAPDRYLVCTIANASSTGENWSVEEPNIPEGADSGWEINPLTWYYSER